MGVDPPTGVRPTGLSARSERDWVTLMATYAFSVAETQALAESFRHRGLGDQLAAAGQTKLAQGQWTLAHRWWKALKFTPASATARPNRMARWMPVPMTPPGGAHAG